MRVFLDTNVLVSAFATRGLSADLLELVLVGHELVTGRAVLRELDRVLRAKLKIPPPRAAEIVAFVSGEAVQVAEDAPLADCKADEDDRLVLGEALAVGAEVCVTGDGALLALGRIGQMRIVSPRELWQLLREQERQ
ncbi:MAG: putative toxin-antitoxin system toxin component, PIN family [Betaproteobacteria bacterium]